MNSPLVAPKGKWLTDCVSRVLAVGLDAAESTYVESLLRDGRMPNLAHLLSAGTWHKLATEQPWQQSIAINEFLRGRRPRPSDSWDVCRFDPADYRVSKPIAMSQLGSPAFYELERGLKTIVFDVPWSSIGSGPDSVEVLAWGAHSPHHPRASRPAGLLEDLDRAVGFNPGFMNSFYAKWHDRESIDSLIEGCVIGAHRRADAWAYLQRRFPDWDLALMVMAETHDAGELLWQGIDPRHPLASVVDTEQAASGLERIYTAVDEAIGRIVSECPPDTSVVVYSLFGMCSGSGDTPSLVLLPELLQRLWTNQSNLHIGHQDAWRRAGCPPVVPRPSHDWRDSVAPLFKAPDEGIVKHFRNRVESEMRARLRPWKRRISARLSNASLGALGYPIPHEVAAVPTREDADKGDSLDWQFPIRYRRWWSRLPAFVLPTFSEGMVRINVEGREASGIVRPSDYEGVCDRVEEAARSCVNPRTGRPAVKDVVRRSLGGYESTALYADLVVVWDGPTDSLDHPELGMIGPVPFNRPGAHTANAFAVVSPSAGSAGADNSLWNGPTGGAGRPGHILDLPPTFFALLGKTVPAVLQGKPLVSPFVDWDKTPLPAIATNTNPA